MHRTGTSPALHRMLIPQEDGSITTFNTRLFFFLFSLTSTWQQRISGLWDLNCSREFRPVPFDLPKATEPTWAVMCGLAIRGFSWEAGDANSGLSPKDCSWFSMQCNPQMHKLYWRPRTAYPAASCPAIFAASCLCLTLASPKTLKYSPAKKEKEGKECFHTNSLRTHT